MTPKLLTLPAFHALFEQFKIPTGEMLIILRPYDTQVINITSVSSTFWAILDSHMGNVNNLPPLWDPNY